LIDFQRGFEFSKKIEKARGDIEKGFIEVKGQKIDPGEVE
jgi:hypothetical protein